MPPVLCIHLSWLFLCLCIQPTLYLLIYLVFRTTKSLQKVRWATLVVMIRFSRRECGRQMGPIHPQILGSRSMTTVSLQDIIDRKPLPFLQGRTVLLDGDSIDRNALRFFQCSEKRCDPSPTSVDFAIAIEIPIVFTATNRRIMKKVPEWRYRVLVIKNNSISRLLPTTSDVY